MNHPEYTDIDASMVKYRYYSDEGESLFYACFSTETEKEQLVATSRKAYALANAQYFPDVGYMPQSDFEEFYELQVEREYSLEDIEWLMKKANEQFGEDDFFRARSKRFLFGFEDREKEGIVEAFIKLDEKFVYVYYT